nr:Ig-like domain-containing protein [Shewanella sp. cp20]
MTATSPVNKELRHDLINASSELLLSGSCDEGIAIYNTFQMRDAILHPLAASYNVDFDIDNNGVWDYTATTVNLQWFNDLYPRSLYGFVKEYGTASGTLEPAFHVTGNDFVTIKACFEDMSLTSADLGQNVTVRYRVEESDWAPVSTGSGDEVVTTLMLDGSGTSAQLVDEEGNDVSELAPGESAFLTSEVGANSMGYMFLSENGSMSITANITEEGNSAPTIEDTTLSVDKGTEAGSELGKLMVTDPDMLTSPFSEFIVLNSNSNMLVIEKDGTVKLSDSAVIDQQSESMIAEVVAIDTMGNRSESATVTVEINNTVPTVSPSGMTSTEGFVVTAKANGKDADGDKLTYTWTQTAGTPVTFNNGGAEIKFTAPEGNHTLTFSVVASDGRAESEAGTATITVNAKEEKSSSGGSLGWFALLMLPFAALRRRK